MALLCVSELHALSVHSSCIKFSLSGDKVFLSLTLLLCFPDFTSEVLELSAFSSMEDQSLVRALQAYINQEDQCFPEEQPAFYFMAAPSQGESHI